MILVFFHIMINNILDIEKGLDEGNFEESDGLLNEIEVFFIFSII